jgi:hypothetical protein
VATDRAALGPGHPSDRCPPNPCQGRGQARLRVYMCQAPSRSSVALRSQTGSTANLQGFRIRAPEGWTFLQHRPPALTWDAAFVRAVTGSNASPAVLAGAVALRRQTRLTPTVGEPRWLGGGMGESLHLPANSCDSGASPMAPPGDRDCTVSRAPVRQDSAASALSAATGAELSRTTG